MLGKKFRKIPVQFISSLIGSFFFLYMTQGMIRTVLDVGIQVSMFFSLLGLGLLPTSSVSSHGDETGDRTVSSHQRNRAGRKGCWRHGFFLFFSKVLNNTHVLHILVIMEWNGLTGTICSFSSQSPLFTGHDDRCILSIFLPLHSSSMSMHPISSYKKWRLFNGNG